MKNFRLLGRTGLRVSPLSLGTMTFGEEWGWGSNESAARAIFDRYVDAGGNFVDTADGYTGGTSETLVGKFIADRKLRDRIVLATKYTFNQEPGNPNAGGNGRKNLHRAIEGSLRRLRTDYIDLFWVHAWDTVTPIEEVMSSLNGLVQSGKVRYIGLSDCPAWYVSRAQTLAEFRGWERLAAVQLEYSLVERGIEPEFTALARELGIGINAWSPLASGLLSGKYRSAADLGNGRLGATLNSGNPLFERVTKDPRNWEIVATLVGVAKELGRSPAQVALNWVTTQPGVASTIIGATKLSQLEDNLGALDFVIPPALRARLEAISAPITPALYLFFGETLQSMIAGGTTLERML